MLFSITTSPEWQYLIAGILDYAVYILCHIIPYGMFIGIFYVMKIIPACK